MQVLHSECWKETCGSQSIFLSTLEAHSNVLNSNYREWESGSMWEKASRFSVRCCKGKFKEKNMSAAMLILTQKHLTLSPLCGAYSFLSSYLFFPGRLTGGWRFVLAAQDPQPSPLGDRAIGNLEGARDQRRLVNPWSLQRTLEEVPWHEIKGIDLELLPEERDVHSIQLQTHHYVT